MIYDSVLGRSFSKQEQKKLGYWAFVACLFIALSFFTSFKPFLGPLSVLNLRLSMGEDEKLHLFSDTDSSLLIANETLGSSSSTVNDTSSSHEEAEIMRSTLIVNDTDSSHGESEILDAEIIMNSTSIDNATSRSQEVFKESHTRNMKTNDTSNSPPLVKEKDIYMVNNTNSSLPKATDADVVTKNNTIEPLCTLMSRSDFCEIKGDIRIDGKSYTVFIVSSETDILTAENTSWSMRPYARKGDQAAMAAVREWTVKLVTGASDIPQCTQNHRVPAILFSAGGYAGNHFHAFTDVILPLFLTSRPYNGEVQFLITNGRPAWISKFETIMKALSRYQLVSIDNSQDIHCYDSMTVGLKRRTNKELSIDPDPSSSPYSMNDFRKFLRSSYSLKKTMATKIRNGSKKRPRLLIISRKRSRAFTNVGEIVTMAKRLGYRVATAEPDADVSGFAKIINSCDVVMGVHGAGLTNIVFLPENAVLVQVIPFGGTEWLSRTYFEEPAKGMNIRYLDYKIRVEESTLIQQYPADHVVLRDPSAIWKQGWFAVQSIYLRQQNVTLDVNRFRPTLVKALDLLHQ